MSISTYPTIPTCWCWQCEDIKRTDILLSTKAKLLSSKLLRFVGLYVWNKKKFNLWRGNKIFSVDWLLLVSVLGNQVACSRQVRTQRTTNALKKRKELRIRIKKLTPIIKSLQSNRAHEKSVKWMFLLLWITFNLTINWAGFKTHWD